MKKYLYKMGQHVGMDLYWAESLSLKSELALFLFKKSRWFQKGINSVFGGGEPNEY
jgi:hypothetical protein